MGDFQQNWSLKKRKGRKGTIVAIVGPSLL